MTDLINFLNHYHIIERLLPVGIAIFCGCVLGIERELSHKPAGLRTQVLITLGSTLFVLGGTEYGFEPARVAANVITGLGFLGAGVTMHYKGSIRGITTSAIIWVNGAIGLAVGIGDYGLAFMGTVAAVFSLRFLGIVEYFITRRCRIVQYSVNLKEDGDLIDMIKETLTKCHYLEEPLKFNRREKVTNIRFAFCNPHSFHDEFLAKLRENPNVLSVYTNS